MRPKGKLFALVVLFAAVGLLTATGAFTTVEADRTAEISTTGDASALLALEPADNSEFATVNSAGEVVIQLNGSSADTTSGVNTNASTADDNVLNITNNGEENVDVSVTANGGVSEATVVFYNATGSLNNTNGDTVGDMANDPQSANGVAFDERYTLNDSAIQVNSGQTEMVGIYIETYGMDNSTNTNVIDSVTITAEER